MTTIAIISNQAFSLINFRGPLIQSLVQKGVSVIALAPDYDEISRQRISDLGATPADCNFDRVGMNPVRDVVNTLKLAFQLRRLRPDVTLAYFIKPVIFGTFAAWLARVPKRIAMIEGLGFVFTDSGDSTSVKRKALRYCASFLYRRALKRAEKVIFLNRDDLQQFVEEKLVGREKSVCLGGIGVDLVEWPIAPPVVQPVTFLLAARLLREKGIVEYVNAARRVKQLYPQSRFILLGGLDPNPGGLSQAEVESWGQEEIIEWPGHVTVPPWLEQTSVYVLPSYREGVPRSTQEAMAMARPVITTDAPGCRETVIDGQNGFLIPVRDEKSLAEKMKVFIENPSLIETMGLASRRLAEERFDVHQINKVIMQILKI